MLLIDAFVLFVMCGLVENMQCLNAVWYVARTWHSLLSPGSYHRRGSSATDSLIIIL